jgi:hypothetical protein
MFDISSHELDFDDKASAIEGLEEIPDGALTIN